MLCVLLDDGRGSKEGLVLLLLSHIGSNSDIEALVLLLGLLIYCTSANTPPPPPPTYSMTRLLRLAPLRKPWSLGGGLVVHRA